MAKSPAHVLWVTLLLGCTHAPDANPAPASSAPSSLSTSAPAASTPEASHPPPPASPSYRSRKRTAPAGTHPGKPVTSEVWVYTTPRNPVDPSGRSIYARANDTCFYETPTFVPPGKNPPMGWRGRDQHDIDCPPSMDDPTWDECAPGEIRQDPASGRCMCEAVASVMGPDTPRNFIGCPRPPAGGASPR